MQKNTLKISFYMILFSFIAKIVSFLSRIVLARSISTTAMSYYSILSPTILILITCVQMGIPSIVSKIVAKKGYTFKEFTTSIYFSIFTTCITSIIYCLCIPTLTYILYKQDFKTLLYSVLPYLPCVSISGLLKGYLLGRRKFLHASISTVIEEIVRIVFLCITFNTNTIHDPITMCKIAIFAMSIGEITAIIYMFIIILFEKHTILIPLVFSKTTFKIIMKDAIPISSARFIGSITHFLEPIILHITLSNTQYTSMLLIYGYMNGYVMPLIMMPSFLTIALSSYLLPSFLFEYSRNNHKKANTMIFLIIYFCLFINTIYCLTLYFYSDFICMLLYKTIEMSIYLKQMALPFILYSIQPIASTIMHAFGYSTYATIDTTIGCILRLLCLAFMYPILQENTFIFSICIGMISTTFLHVCHICFRKKRYI